MKKLALIALLLCACMTLCACDALSALSYSITGEIINPVDGFSRGGDKSTLVFGGSTYILIEELNGDFDFSVGEESLLLGETSNFPFFTNFYYYANKTENADYIAGASGLPATFVYLREDLYTDPLLYVLQNTDYEFDFSSAFTVTDEVSFKKDIKGQDRRDAKLKFYVKGFPELVASVTVYEINGKWYYVDNDEVFALSESFLGAVTQSDLL